MPTGFAIAAIVAFALSIFFLRVASNVKMWRLWWMDLLGVLDVELDRDSRKSQERQMSLMCFGLFILLLATSFSTTYWTVAEIREAKRERSPVERELDIDRQAIEKMRVRIGGR